jgi:hypothetical protein
MHEVELVAQSRKKCLCTNGRMSPREEEAYVRRGACVTQRRRHLCIVRRMKLCMKNEATS